MGSLPVRFGYLLPVFLGALLAGCSSARLARYAPPPATDRQVQGAPDDEWRRLRIVPPGSDSVPAERYAAAAAHIAAMPRVTVGNQPWIPLGPGNVGGRTRSLVIDPTNASVMYAGAVSGGVWKTTNGGQSWTPLTDSLPNLNIGALGIDPSNHLTIYAGGGEQYSSSPRPGVGIFQSTDGGATWNLLSGTANNTAFAYVNRVLVSPNNSLHLYAATSTGVYASADGGATWKAAPVSANFYGCQDLVIRNDVSTDYLFAACSGAVSTAPFAVWRNTDAAGSGTWSNVFSASQMGRTVLALAPSQQSTIYAGAAMSNPADPRESPFLGMYRSTANGDAGSWTTQSSASSSNVFTTLLFSNYDDAQAYCASGGPVTPDNGTWGKLLAVDPLDPNRVWAGNVDLYRSDDGGVTWGAASLWMPASFPQSSHADRHLIVFPPGYDGSKNQTVLQANDGGVWQSNNARAAVSTGAKAGCASVWEQNSATTWSNLANSYASVQFWHGAAYPGGTTYAGGMQDNGVRRGSDGGANSWLNLSNGGDGYSVVVDPVDVNRVLWTVEYLAFNRTTDGSNFSPAVNGITESSSSFPMDPFITADPNEPAHLFAGGAVSLWRSVDEGNSWTAAAPVEAGSFITAITVSPTDSNTVLFGTQQGYIYRSSSALTSSGGGAWSSARPRASNVASIAFDPSNANTVYAVYSNLKGNSSQAHVYKSLDGGATWAPSDGSGATAVPDIGTYRLRVDPYTHTTLYLASDLGLFLSNDGGQSWNHDSTLPNVVIGDLGFDRDVFGNWLFAYTHGRGVYKTLLPGAPQALANCTFTVTAPAISDSGLGGVYPVTVTTQPGCSWNGVPATVGQNVTVQSPAQGTGSGTAYILAGPVPPTGSPSNQVVNVAGTNVTVSQSVPVFVALGNDAESSAGTLTPPTAVRQALNNMTSSAGDPVHSCTGSADFHTTWWKVTPASSGTLTVQGGANGTGTLVGNAGIVLTAYAQSAPATELACATHPQDGLTLAFTSISFPVTAGATYLIEASATTAAGGSSSNAILYVTLGGPPVAVTMTPSTASVSAGGAPVPLTAAVANAGNTAVRWSISPSIGVISQAGVYTPPASVSGPATVIVTATAFADTTKSASAQVTVTPPSGAACTLTAPPTLTSVNSAGDFGGVAGFASGSWLEVHGQNLAVDSRSWAGGDFQGVNAPIGLDGSGVLINGIPAFVSYISPTQINVQAPADATVGAVKITANSCAGSSAPVTLQKKTAAPGLLAPGAFNVGGKQYLAALFQDGVTFVGQPNLIPGALFRPAVPGDAITVYGIGFGPVTPATPPGVVVSGANSLPNVTVAFGQTQAAVGYAGLAPGVVGLYQFNLTVPNVAPGDYQIAFTLNGAAVPQVAYLTVGQ